jgi:branched-chain amino acid transport system permease protein
MTKSEATATAPVTKKKPNAIGVTIFVLLLFTLPLFLPTLLEAISGIISLKANFLIFQLTLVIIYAIAILGLNIVTGYNGQISLGHGAFYAIGAYTAAVLMDKLDCPYWLTIPISGIVCLGVGFLFGLPALRLQGHYLALATFALALAVPQLLKYNHIEWLTGGVQGIVIMKPDPPFGIKAINSDQWLYYLCLVVACVMFWLAVNLIRGRLGRAMIAIRDHPIAAEAMGINLTIVKSMAFGISAAYTGVAGALGAIAIAFVAPDSFTIFLSISFLVGVVIGGLASITGAIYGAIFIQFIPNIADEISRAAPWAIYGLFLIAAVYVMPTGAAGLVRRLKAKWR